MSPASENRGASARSESSSSSSGAAPAEAHKKPALCDRSRSEGTDGGRDRACGGDRERLPEGQRTAEEAERQRTAMAGKEKDRQERSMELEKMEWEREQFRLKEERRGRSGSVGGAST